MNFLVTFHKTPVSVCCVYVSLCVGGSRNPIFIDEETEYLRNKCFLENLLELPKGKVNTQINFFITALCHLVNN